MFMKLFMMLHLTNESEAENLANMETMAEELASATMSRMQHGNGNKKRAKKTKYDYKQASACVRKDYLGPGATFSDQ